MASTDDTILPIPDELVAKGAGFSLDIGGSIAKVFYRSKEEYENGKPKDNKKHQSGVHMVNFPRDDIDDVIKLLKEKCDVTRDASGVANVHTTGFGGSLYKKKIEEALNVTIHNEPEFDLFTAAFRQMAKHVPKDKLFLPLSEEALKFGDVVLKMLGKVDENMQIRGHEYAATPESYTLPDDPDEYFPCLMVLAGSGNPFLLVEKTGAPKVIDFPILGGRFMLGFSKLCFGVENFHEMEELIANSDQGVSCDVFPTDLTPPPPPGQNNNPPDDEDVYNSLSRQELIAKKFRIYPFGKATIPGFKDATKGDMLYSMQRSVAEQIAQTAFYATFQINVKNVFFAGNFVSTPRVRDFMTEQFHLQNLKTKPSERRNLRFIRNGGHLGAIGGYLFSKKK